MGAYLALSDESRVRVEAVVRGEAPVSSLKGPEELHYAAKGWNWDLGPAGPSEIVARPDCSLATLLLVYWSAEPVDLFADCANAEEAEDEYGSSEVFAMLERIEARVAASDYAKAAIGFNPKDDDGFDLTEDLSDMKLARPVPEYMTRAAKGPLADPGFGA